MATERHFIRQWRKFRSLTQAQLAERIGIAESYVSKIESGKRRYDQHFLEAAAEALRCSPADLIMRDPTREQPLWSIFDQIPESSRPQAVAMLRALTRTGTDN